jgi:YD repeat-containing protein
MRFKPAALGLSVFTILFTFILIHTGSGESGATSSDGSRPDYGPQAIGGDPVDLSTGLYLFEDDDIVAFEQPPVRLTRTYRNRDRVSRAFGIGGTHPYDIYLIGDGKRFSYADLILKDGGRIRFERVSPGIGYSDAIFEHTATPTEFYRARLAWDRSGWTMKLTNGASYTFLGCSDESMCGLVRYTDAQGKTVEVKRDRQGRVQAIITPGGKRITLDTDPKGRIKSAEYRPDAKIYQRCDYDYDARGRLIKVRKKFVFDGKAKESVTSYSYDDLDQIRTVHWSDLSMINDYDDGGRVIRQTLSDGRVFRLRYVLDSQSRITQTDIWQPDGTLNRFTFNAQGYTLTDTVNVGLLTEQMITYKRETPGNWVVAVGIRCRTEKGLFQTEEKVRPGKDSGAVVKRLKERCTEKEPQKFEPSDFAFSMRR